MTDIQLHADDPMGRAAHKCAMLIGRQEERLLAAASPNISREARAENLTRFFQVHRAFCRHLTALEEAAQTCAANGYERDAEMEHFIVEGKALP